MRIWSNLKNELQKVWFPHHLWDKKGHNDVKPSKYFTLQPVKSFNDHLKPSAEWIKFGCFLFVRRYFTQVFRSSSVPFFIKKSTQRYGGLSDPFCYPPLLAQPEFSREPNYGLSSSGSWSKCQSLLRTSRLNKATIAYSRKRSSTSSASTSCVCPKKKVILPATALKGRSTAKNDISGVPQVWKKYSSIYWSGSFDKSRDSGRFTVEFLQTFGLTVFTYLWMSCSEVGILKQKIATTYFILCYAWECRAQRINHSRLSLSSHPFLVLQWVAIIS